MGVELKTQTNSPAVATPKFRKHPPKSHYFSVNPRNSQWLIRQRVNMYSTIPTIHHFSCQQIIKNQTISRETVAARWWVSNLVPRGISRAIPPPAGLGKPGVNKHGRRMRSLFGGSISRCGVFRVRERRAILAGLRVSARLLRDRLWRPLPRRRPPLCELCKSSGAIIFSPRRLYGWREMGGGGTDWWLPTWVVTKGIWPRWACNAVMTASEQSALFLLIYTKDLLGCNAMIYNCVYWKIRRNRSLHIFVRCEI